MEAPVVKLRHHRTYCFRDFPPGCGPGAVVAAQRKLEEKPPCLEPAQPLAPPPPTAADDGVDEASDSGEGKRMVNEDAHEPVSVVMFLAAEQEDASVAHLVKVTGNDATESSGTLEGSRILVDVKGDKESRGITGSCPESVKLKSLELLESISEGNDRIAGTPEPAESISIMQADGAGKHVCYSKLYPPPRKNISAVRHYPIGCGWNATPMSSEERLNLVKEAALKNGICMLREDKMLANHIPEKKMEVPVVQQVIKVSQIEIAQSSKSPSHVVGSLSRSVVTYKEKKIPPSSTSNKLQKSKENDMVLNKRKTFDEVKDEHQVTNNRKISNEASKDYANKIMVQALVAAPNCPWKQGQKSKACSSLPAVRKTNVKRDKTAPSDEFALIGFEDKEGRLHERGENGRDETTLALHEGSSKREVSINPTVSSGSTARKGKVKRDGTSFPKQLMLTELDKEDSIPRHRENGIPETGLSFYEGKNEWNLNINPIVPSGSNSRKDNSINKSRAPLVKQLVVAELEVVEGSLAEHEDNDSDEETFALYAGSNEWSVNITPILPSYNRNDRKDVAARQKFEKILQLFWDAYREELHRQKTQKNGSEKKKMINTIAYNTLKSKGQCLATSKQFFGDVPGVEVGDKFQLRVELAVVGLHRPLQGGIGWAKKCGISVAVSVVTSKGYPDNLNSLDVVIYTGSGGIPGGANRLPEDQKLQGGNLSLKNSISTKTPVRVILRFNNRTKRVSTFTYAGLYLVEEYWQEKGLNGFKVFKFKLRKIPGQPELSLQEVKRSKNLSIRQGLCIKDISGGKEHMPICVINKIDDDRPMPFNYITEINYPSWHFNAPPKGCDCRDDCSDTEKCACAKKNGGKIPYNFNGDLVHDKKLVFECGPSCKCASSCYNRVAQHGIKIPLEIFKTEKMGWGVRSSCPIPSGSFICEYIGELLQDEEAEKRTNDEYLFDIGRNYDDPSLWKDLPDHMLNLQTTSSPGTMDGGYTIDAAEQGNVARFINHSCSPNLYALDVFYDHGDRRMPHVMLFAGRSIAPLQELTYDYNYKIDGLHDSEGNIKRKDCYCGSSECCGRLY